MSYREKVHKTTVTASGVVAKRRADGRPVTWRCLEARRGRRWICTREKIEWKAMVGG